MKKFLALILFAFVPSAVAAAQATDSLGRQDVSIRKSNVIRSAVLSKEQQIQIALPEGYEGSDKTYPVVDILDWQWQFSHSVSFSTRLMATETIPEVNPCGDIPLQAGSWPVRRGVLCGTLGDRWIDQGEYRHPAFSVKRTPLEEKDA